MIIYLAIAFLVGLGVGLMVGKYSGAKRRHVEKVPDEADVGKILSLFDGKDKIKNDDVEQLLGVSDATATRYLSRLEERGVLARRGQSKGTYYVRNT